MSDEPAQIVRRAANWLATASNISYRALAEGPLGEALTREELEHLADNPQACREFVAQARASADRMEAREACTCSFPSDRCDEGCVEAPDER